jgi:predicted MFS family arabinose efflux permease
MLPGVLLAFPGGLLVRRFGDRQVCCAELALMAAGGVLVGYGQGLGVVMIGRLISGVGGVFLSLAITKMVTDWFAGREIVTAMSVMLTSWPVGIGAGLLIFAPLTVAYGWSSVMYLAAGASVGAMLLIWSLYRSPTSLGSPQKSSAGKPALVLPSRQEVLSVITAGAAWGLLNVGLVAFFSFVPPLLAGHGFSLAGAAFVTSSSSGS